MIISAKPEVVINATWVNNTESEETQYEFVLDDTLSLSECGEVDVVNQGIISRIVNAPCDLHGMLFELNHVRVNPNVDNTEILSNLANALEGSGVNIINRPSSNMMAVCYKPMGELSDVVRFYVNVDETLIFLSNSVKLTLLTNERYANN